MSAVSCGWGRGRGEGERRGRREGTHGELAVFGRDGRTRPEGDRACSFSFLHERCWQLMMWTHVVYLSRAEVLEGEQVSVNGCVQDAEHREQQDRPPHPP